MKTIFAVALALLLPLLAFGGVTTGPSSGASATNVAGGTFANVTLTGSSTIPSATTANLATNGTDGVRLIRGNDTTNYFGTGEWALSNALAVAVSGDTIKLGEGVQNCGLTNLMITVPNITIKGAGLGTRDPYTGLYTSGTILKNGFVINQYATNFTLADLGINVSNGFAYHFAMSSIRDANATIRKVGVTHNGWTNALEDCYVAGNNILIEGGGIYNITNSHGLIIKGASNVVVRNFHLQNAGGTLQALLLKSADTNIQTCNVRIQNILIDGDISATCVPILLHADDEGLTKGNPIILDGVTIEGVNIRLPNAQGPEVLKFIVESSNDIIRNVTISGVVADYPKAVVFGDFYRYPMGYPTNGLVTNIVISGCSFISTNAAPGPFDISGAGWTNAWVKYDINVNGKKFVGHDNYWGQTSSGGNLANGTNAVNIYGGLSTDTLRASTNYVDGIFAGPSAAVTFRSPVSFANVINNNYTSIDITNVGFGSHYLFTAGSTGSFAIGAGNNTIGLTATSLAMGGGATITVDAPGVASGNLKFDANGSLALGAVAALTGNHNLMVGGGIFSSNNVVINGTGSFTGNGSGLTNLNASALSGIPVFNTTNAAPSTYSATNWTRWIVITNNGQRMAIPAIDLP
jgi:hypothetical protein